MKNIFLISNVIFMTFFNVPSFAQDQLNKDSIRVSMLDRVVITGTGTKRLLKDSPAPITIITAKELRNTNAFTLDDALQKLSSSFTTMSNTMGTTINLNGMPDDYFIFLENGKRLDGADPASRIDISKIKRIEVLSGASAVLYGTNAIGGVVNIITEDSNSDHDNVSIISNTKFNSNNRFTQSINAEITSGKLTSSTNYRRQQADNWQLSPYALDKEGELVITDKIASTGYTSDILTQRFDFRVNDRLSITANGSIYDRETDRPYSVYSYNIHHKDYTYGVGARYNINDKDILIFDYFYEDYTSSYEYFKDYTKKDILKGESIVRKATGYHNTNVKGIFNLGENNILSVGTELVSNILTDEGDNIDSKNAYTVALFAQNEIKIARNLRGVVGVRYSYHENFKSYATPNASLMYSLGKFNLRATYASGFRAPTLTELYASTVSSKDVLNLANPNLKPEKSDYYSVSAEYANKWLSLSVTGFQNNVRDMINYVTLATGDAAMEGWGNAEVQQRQNISRAEILGATLSANASLGRGFGLNASYTYLDAKDLDLNQPIDKSIEHVGVVNAYWGQRWGTYGFNVNVNGRIYSERFSKTYGDAPAYQLWDINTSHAFYFDSVVVEPGIGIQNILNYTDDRPWNSNYATLTPGRSISANLTIRF